MITATLTDDVGTLQLPVLEVPLGESILDSSVDVVTLDNNMFTDFTVQKRSWSLPYTWLKEHDYNDVREFYDRQFSLLKYPTLTINRYGTITDIPVRMYLNTKEVWNNCGDVQNIQLTFRETDQLESGGS